MDVTPYGTRRLLGAIREGNPTAAFIGAALLAYGLLRRLDGPREERVYTTKLKRGQRVEIAVTEPGTQRTR